MPNTSPRWNFACSRCNWIGNKPEETFAVGVGAIADCPVCGHSCTCDEATFEPRAGVLDGSAEGFDPVWPVPADGVTN